MSEELTVADVLERAADLIEPEGAWGQGTSVNRCGPLCLGLAIEIAAEDGEVRPCFLALYAAAPFSGMDGLIKWNDASGRQQDEVVSLVREAAALSRARGEGE